MNEFRSFCFEVGAPIGLLLVVVIGAIFGVGYWSASKAADNYNQFSPVKITASQAFHGGVPKLVTVIGTNYVDISR